VDLSVPQNQTFTECPQYHCTIHLINTCIFKNELFSTTADERRKTVLRYLDARYLVDRKARLSLILYKFLGVASRFVAVAVNPLAPPFLRKVMGTDYYTTDRSVHITDQQDSMLPLSKYVQRILRETDINTNSLISATQKYLTD
jgi:hypothetical protein